MLNRVYASWVFSRFAEIISFEINSIELWSGPFTHACAA
ncbi:hypothetical protein LG3211_0644 [Lysobacter gummosus]|nr:hypothetical protein LG3211_0644 [Lysobacter gummosus]